MKVMLALILVAALILPSVYAGSGVILAEVLHAQCTTAGVQKHRFKTRVFTNNTGDLEHHGHYHRINIEGTPFETNYQNKSGDLTANNPDEFVTFIPDYLTRDGNTFLFGRIMVGTTILDSTPVEPPQDLFCVCQLGGVLNGSVPDNTQPHDHADHPGVDHEWYAYEFRNGQPRLLEENDVLYGSSFKWED